MASKLRILAMLLLLDALLTWVGTGASRGWTKTTAFVEKTDDVTGLTYHEDRKVFEPGVDFLIGAAGTVGLLLAVSFLLGQTAGSSGKPKEPQTT
jgi:hypothetical protein